MNKYLFKLFISSIDNLFLSSIIFNEIIFLLELNDLVVRLVETLIKLIDLNLFSVKLGNLDNDEQPSKNYLYNLH